MNGKMVIVESAVYSSPDTALKFSECLIDKMKQSQSFTYDEVNSMVEVQDVMVQSLFNTERALSFAKILAIAFVTSFADIIILKDIPKNTYRKQIYVSALEQCSLWATGDPDIEFINEALRIMSVIENNKALKYEETGAFDGVRNPAVGTFDYISPAQTSGVDRSLAVQPSPVQNQNPPIQQYFPSNDKTGFEQQEKPYFPSLTSAAQAAVQSQYVNQPSSQIDFSSGFATGTQTQSRNFPPKIDLPSTSQTGGFSSGFGSSSKSEDFAIGSDESRMPQFATSILGPHPEIHPPDYDNDRISIANDRPVVSSYFESPQIGLINENVDSQSYKGLSIPQTKESSVVVIPPKLDEHLSQNPQRGAEEEMYKPINNLNEPNLEKSPFSKNITVTIPQAQEQYFDFTSYSELHRTFFNILINSPKFRETFNTEIPKDNAINLARSITEQTFADYDVGIINDGLTAVTGEVIKVSAPSPENFALALSNALVSILKLHETSFSIEKSQLAINFLYALDNSAQFYPKPEAAEKLPQDYKIDEEQDYSEFHEKKIDFDFGSPTLSPEDRKDEIFSIALSQYLSNSEAIRDFFCGDSSTEDKVQIFFSIIKASLIDYGFHAASLAASVASSALSELSDEGLCNNYAKTMSETIAEILEENEIENANAENVANKMELNLSHRQIIPTEPQNPTPIFGNFPPRIPETYETAPKLESSFESVEEIPSNNQGKTEDANLVTSSDIDGVSVYDYEFTYPMTLLHASTSSSTVRPTVNSPEWAANGTINEEALADYLSEKTDAFESYISKESQTKETNDEETSPKIEIIKNDYDLPTEEFSYKSQTPMNQKNNFNTQTDIVAISGDQFKEKKDGYYPTVTEYKEAISDHQDKTETLQEDSIKPNLKTNPVELQPSFQDPIPKPEDSNVRSQQNSDTVSYDYINTTKEFSMKMSETVESSIAYIRSQNFDLDTMCTRINQLAPLVDIPALDYCEPVAAVDYTLNVLRAVVRILGGV